MRKSELWGLKKITLPYDGNKFTGTTAPLWKNPAKKFLLISAAACLLVSCGCWISYVSKIRLVGEYSFPIKPFLMTYMSMQSA